MSASRSQKNKRRRNEWDTPFASDEDAAARTQRYRHLLAPVAFPQDDAAVTAATTYHEKIVEKARRMDAHFNMYYNSLIRKAFHSHDLVYFWRLATTDSGQPIDSELFPAQRASSTADEKGGKDKEEDVLPNAVVKQEADLDVPAVPLDDEEVLNDQQSFAVPTTDNDGV